jgi:hypothetical protein
MHPHLLELLVKERIEEQHREAARFRLARQAGRYRRRRARRRAPQVTAESKSSPEVSAHAPTAETSAAPIEKPVLWAT